MISSESEKLQETVIDLLRSQERESQLQDENEAILEGISAMAGANDKRQVFNSLLEVLRKFIGFDQALVLTREDDQSMLDVLVSTDNRFGTSSWQIENTFKRAINGECIALYSPKDVIEFRDQPKVILDEYQSALLTGVKVSSSDAVMILMSHDKSQFTPRCRRVLNRFRPLLARAIIDIDYRERLQSLVAARTQQLTFSQQRFKDFAKTAGDWFWEIDINFNFTYISEPHIANYPITCDNFIEFFQDYPQFQKKLELKLAEQVVFEDLEWNIKKTNSEQWFNFSGTPYFDKYGKLQGYRGTAKNITSRKKRLFDLQEARKQAESANKAKSQFIAMMSHEIRTPLNAVLGLMESLSLSGLDSKQKLWLSQMDQSAHLLLTIINDILDLSRIESGSFRLFNSDINIVESIKLVADQLSPQAAKKNVQLQCEIDDSIPKQIYGDKNRIAQVLFNLIGNAVKFTSVGSVRIVARKIEETIEIAVIDTGIGIAKDAQENIFNPFHQADGSITRRYGGTGLGLAISQYLIEKMKGKISLESELGTGSCFKISIPIVYPSLTSCESDTQSKHKSNCSLNILLAEDSNTNQLVAKLMLERRGHKVAITNNGKEAINVLLQGHNKFDLVLMDISMPVLDGLEATKQLRKREISIPIVALTANAMQSDQKIYHEIGMDGFLAKPICSNELDQLLEKYQELKEKQSTITTQ
ncbi:hybrid sensor histidine kinase/response regulator [Photobacterium leiognathi]|uniref:hybrid sensor histidine kinase/response regulator n=1 Tax=Photobacterium leiognathi TaxID=553611 RepID=UPI00076ABAD6|nr:ATP-binding protein [Photobacterium leiognathi]